MSQKNLEALLASLIPPSDPLNAYNHLLDDDNAILTKPINKLVEIFLLFFNDL